MSRVIQLVPLAVHSITNSRRLDPGTSPYPNGNTPSVTLAEAWADDDNTSYWYPAGGNVGLVTFEPPPGSILIRKLTIRMWWDYSQAGPNNWYFPPDNAHGPRMRIKFLGRDDTTEHDGAWVVAESVGGLPGNVNVSTMPNAFDLYEQTVEHTAHPDGGPWTFEDIVRFKAGGECDLDDGPSGRPWVTGVPGNIWFKVRVVKLRLELEVDDLGADVEHVRRYASWDSRLYRRARNVAAPAMLAHRRVGSVGSLVYMSHRRGASVVGRGWGRRRLDRAGGQILQRTFLPEQMQVGDEIHDRRAYACLAWAAYRIDAPWSPELNGLAFIEKGAGFTHTRDQVAWSPRPGDGSLMAVVEDYPNLSEEGLACQGGADESICLRNYDLTESGWSSVEESGEYAATQDEEVALVEEFGYQTSARLEYGSSGGSGGQERSLGTLPYNAGDRVHVWAQIRNTVITDPDTEFAELGLRREGGGLAAPEWWDETARQWTTTETYSQFPSSGPYGRLILDSIPLDAGGASSDPTYYVRVGHFSGTLNDVTFHGAVVDVQHTDDSVAGARTPLIVLDTPITRVEETHVLPHTLAAELWSYERGTHVFEGWPGWRAVDLPADAVKPLLHAQHEIESAVDQHDALVFVAKTGSADLTRFERVVDGESDIQIDCEIRDLNGDPLDLTREHVLRAWVRYLGADGFDVYAPYSVEVGYAVFLKADGSLVGSGSVVGTLSHQTPVTERDYVGIGTDGGSLHFDGHCRMFETRRNPLHGIECVWKV